MTLRNEIFEGLAAAKMARDLVWDPQRAYAEEMYKSARRENQDAEERDKAREETIKAGRPVQQMPTYQLPTVASTAMPGVQPTAMDTSLGPITGKLPISATAPVMPRLPQRTPRFQEGGSVQDSRKIDEQTRARRREQNINREGLWNDPMFDRPVRRQINNQIEDYKERPRFQHGGMVMDEQGLPYRESQPFDPEGDGYDYDQARAAGMEPGEDGHWQSREPNSGLQLKGRKHPTFDKAIETDRRMGYGLEKQNGRYYTKPMKGYADGGLVDDEADQNEADLIVKSLISRDIGEPDAAPAPDFAEDRAAAKINRETGEPWTVLGPSSEYQTQGSRDKMSNEKALRETQAMDATRMQESAPVARGRSRLERATDWMRPDPAAAGQSKRRRELRREINRTEPGLTEELTDSELRQREEKLAGLRGQIGESHAYGAPDVTMPSMPDVTLPKVAIDIGTFTPPMGPAAMTRPATPPATDTNAVARRQINETGGTPEGVPPNGPYPQVPDTSQTPSEQALPRGGRPVAPATPPGNIRPPNQTPGPTPTVVASNGAVVQGSTNGPATPQTGPTGTAAAPAPPLGSAGVNAPSTAPKPVQQALNVVPPPVLKGGLGDQSRTKAYDPVADANDPQNARRVDAGGRAYAPEEIAQVLGGAASVAKTGPNGEPPPVGQGTVSRDNFNAYVQHHSQGGKFSPGEAMLAGMMSDYKMLLKQGRIQQANMMAYGLIQAASIEAASYGRVAGDMIKQGNYGGALQNVVKGANYLPDGMTFSVGPDGKSIVATNASGQVTAQQPVTPQQILAMVTGLADGTLLWQALQTSAAALTKPDRNAEGRALQNEIRRRQIQVLDKKIAGGTGGGGGQSSVASEVMTRLAALGGRSPVVADRVSRQQGSDDDGVMAEQPLEPE